MKQTRELPRLLAPLAGVSLASYIEQLAAKYKVSFLVMLHALGIIESERYEKLNGYGIILSPSRTQNIAKATRLTENRISEMLLRNYDGTCLNLVGIDGSSDALRRVSVSEWAYFSGSHICPECIAESSGAWQLKWKLPWSFACVKHACYLVENCPQCLRRNGSGRADNSLSPLFVGLVPKPGYCGNPQESGIANIGKGAVPCGHWLGGIRTVPASARTRALQEHFNQALLGESQRSMGLDVSSAEYFDDVKGICVLALHAAALEDLGDVSQIEARAFQRFAIRRDSKLSVRRGMENPRAGARTRVLFGVQTEPTLLASICGMAVHILKSSSVEDAGWELRALVTRITEQHGKNRWETGTNFRLSERLSAALTHAMSRTAKFDRTIGNRSGVSCDEGYSFEPRHVPQLMWQDEFEKSFRNFFPGTKGNFARRFCSMSLVKLCGEYTWAEAAQELGLPVQSSIKMANKAVGLLAEGANKKLFGSALHLLAKKLADDDQRIDYAARRHRLRALCSFSHTDWKVLCDATGTTVGKQGGRKKYAAAWLWADLTEGDWTLAPGLQEGNITNLREVYRQLAKEVLPQMATELRQYGLAELLK